MVDFNLDLKDTDCNDPVKIFYDRNPFTKDLGIRVKRETDDSISIMLKIKHRHTNLYGIAHGGVLMSIADATMGAACLNLNKRVVTLDFNMNLLKAVPETDEITARAQVLHNGGKTIVVECTIEDGAGHLCCKARSTMFVVGPLNEQK